MNPSINAASSSSSSTPVGVTTIQLYTGKGKQRAEPPYQEVMIVEGGLSENDFEIAQRDHVDLPDSSHCGTTSYSEIGATFKANTLGNQLYSAYESA